MRFMMLVKSKMNSSPPPKELMDVMGTQAAELLRSGVMLMTGGLSPMPMSTSVRLARGQINKIDGPFAESKEVVGGFAIFEFKSKEEAVESALQFMELHKRYWPGWEGETEVRQILGPEDFPTQNLEDAIKKVCAGGQG